MAVSKAPRNKMVQMIATLDKDKLVVTNVRTTLFLKLDNPNQGNE